MPRKQKSIKIPKPYKRDKYNRVQLVSIDNIDKEESEQEQEEQSSIQAQDVVQRQFPQQPIYSIQEGLEDVLQPPRIQERDPKKIVTGRQLSTNIISTGQILGQFKKPKTLLSMSNLEIYKPKTIQHLGTIIGIGPRRRRTFTVTNFSSIHENDEKLFDLLVKVFTDQRIDPSDIELSKAESELFNAFLYRKFLKRLDEGDFLGAPERLIDKVVMIINRSSKRAEEGYKYLLSKFLRHLKEKFKQTSESSDKSLKVFYEELFGETAKELGLDIEEFYFPSKSKKLGKKNSLNSAYFAKIFKSKAFVESFEDYVNNHLRADHTDDAKSKLEILFDKWRSKYNYVSESRRLRSILKDIANNKKLKLPWIYSEVEESVERVRELIRQHGNP